MNDRLLLEQSEDLSLHEQPAGLRIPRHQLAGHVASPSLGMLPTGGMVNPCNPASPEDARELADVALHHFPLDMDERVPARDEVRRPIRHSLERHSVIDNELDSLVVPKPFAAEIDTGLVQVDQDHASRSANQLGGEPSRTRCDLDDVELSTRKEWMQVLLRHGPAMQLIAPFVAVAEIPPPGLLFAPRRAILRDVPLRLIREIAHEHLRPDRPRAPMDWSVGDIMPLLCCPAPTRRRHAAAAQASGGHTAPTRSV